MECLHGDRVENVRTLGSDMSMSKEIMLKWSTLFVVRVGKGGIYTCLPRFKNYMTPPWLKPKVGIVVRRGWG